MDDTTFWVATIVATEFGGNVEANEPNLAVFSSYEKAYAWLQAYWVDIYDEELPKPDIDMKGEGLVAWDLAGEDAVYVYLQQVTTDKTC